MSDAVKHNQSKKSSGAAGSSGTSGSSKSVKSKKKFCPSPSCDCKEDDHEFIKCCLLVNGKNCTTQQLNCKSCNEWCIECDKHG